MTDITEKMKDNFTNAAWNGQVERMKEVLALHPDAHAWHRGDNGHTALTYAVVSGSMAAKAIDLLLELKADINAQDDAGMTALMHAAGNGGIDTAKKLLEHGADPALVNAEGYTAAQVGDFKDNRFSRDTSAMIRRFVEEQAEEKAAERLRDIQRQADELTQAAVAAAHDGLARSVAVSRITLVKRQGMLP